MQKDLEALCICVYLRCNSDSPRWDCECDHHWMQYIPEQYTEPQHDIDVVRYCNGSMGGHSELWVCPTCSATVPPKHYSAHMEWHKRTETQ